MPYSPNSPMPTDTISLAKWICEVLFLEPSQHQSFFESVLNHHYKAINDQDSQEFHDEMEEYMPGDQREWLAYFLASNLLADVTDKQGKPLIEHCLRVFHSCHNLSPDQRLAALLHDCVEDGKLLESAIWDDIGIEQLISQLFGDTVSKLVGVLSRQKHNSSSTIYVNGKSFLNTYKGYIGSICTYPDAIPIKLADLRDNLDPTRGSIPDSLRQRYEEAREILEIAQAAYSLNSAIDTTQEEMKEFISSKEKEWGLSLSDEDREETTMFKEIYDYTMSDSSTISSHLITEQEAALDSYSLSSLADIEPPYDPPDNYNLDLDLDLDYNAECSMVWDGDEFKEVG